MCPLARIARQALLSSRALAGAVLALSSLIPCSTAQAEVWPSKPIRWIVPYAPGGPTDLASRALAQQLSIALRQPVLVENRAGGGGTVGMNALAKANPDGHTIGTADNALVFTAALHASLPYNPERDLVPLAQYGVVPFIVVVQSGVEAHRLQDLIALARARPGQLTYGTPGIGSPHHLYMELLKSRTGIDIVHVPYKGGAPLVQDLAAGRITMSTSNWGLVSALIRAGTLRPLAVTGAQRIATLPDIPTIAESGVSDFVAYAWQGVIAPAGVAPEVMSSLSQILLQVIDSPETRRSFADLGMTPTPLGAAEFAQFIRNERMRWLPLIKSLAITAD